MSILPEGSGSGNAGSNIGSAFSWGTSIENYIGDLAGIDPSEGVVMPNTTNHGGYQNGLFDIAGGAGWTAPSTPTDRWVVGADGKYLINVQHTTMSATSNGFRFNVKGVDTAGANARGAFSCLSINGNLYLAPYDPLPGYTVTGGLSRVGISPGDGTNSVRCHRSGFNFVMSLNAGDVVKIHVKPYYFGGGVTTSHDLPLRLQVLRLF